MEMKKIKMNHMDKGKIFLLVAAGIILIAFSYFDSGNQSSKETEEVNTTVKVYDYAKEMEEKKARHEREVASAAAAQQAEIQSEAQSAAPQQQPAAQQTSAAQPAVQTAPSPAQPVVQPVSSAEQKTVSEERPLTEEEKWRQAREVVDVTPSEKTMGIYANPIGKVEQASGQVIDLRELTKTDMSLEDLCAELGLIVKKD